MNVNGLKVALKQRADQNGQIILLTIDNDYTEMAMNFYLTSLKKFNIENYLFLTTDTHATQVSWIETVIPHVLAIYIYLFLKWMKSSDDYIPVSGVGHISGTEHIKNKKLNAQRQRTCLQ